MQRTTVTLPAALLEDLVAVSGARNKSQAVTAAVKEEIKRKKWQKIKRMAGKLEFALEAEDIRHDDARLG